MKQSNELAQCLCFHPDGADNASQVPGADPSRQPVETRVPIDERAIDEGHQDTTSMEKRALLGSSPLECHFATGQFISVSEYQNATTSQPIAAEVGSVRSRSWWVHNQQRQTTASRVLAGGSSAAGSFSSPAVKSLFCCMIILSTATQALVPQTTQTKRDAYRYRQ